ncbi:MAG: NAD(P)-binding protein [Isosphaeraceae bacterium]
MGRAALSASDPWPRAVGGGPAGLVAGRAAASANHRLLVVQHRRHASGSRRAPACRAVVVSAALGRRSVAVDAADGDPTWRLAAPRSGPGRPDRSVRD